MLSNNPVLPNFIKTVFTVALTVFSLSAIAQQHEKAPQKIGDLKDMTNVAEEKDYAKDYVNDHAKGYADEKDMQKSKSKLDDPQVKARIDQARERSLVEDNPMAPD